MSTKVLQLFGKVKQGHSFASYESYVNKLYTPLCNLF